jgi:hypothetical protein
MTASLRIQTLSFSGDLDHPVAVGDSELVVLIGPNNAGKSRALRDIETFLQGGAEGQVVRTLSAERIGDADAIRDWIHQTTPSHSNWQPGQDLRSIRDGGILNVSDAVQTWVNGQIPLGQLARLMVFRADAETRLQLASSKPSVDILGGEATEPLQRLISDHQAESRLSESTRQAFDSVILVNRAGGSIVHLHLGSVEAEPRLDDPRYLAELRELPLVADQGDGMRAFIGLVLALTATPFPLVLIDEPEAFLHPPQARELGRQLALPSGQQRIIATHSSHVLLGLLDVATSITIVRLRRSDDRNVPAVLSPQKVGEVWADPSLRYSNLFDGLFHRGVVITEADGDARLYAAALDAELAEQRAPAADVLFTHCDGKHNLPAAIGALRPMGVPVAAIADLDVLRDESLLRRIVEALGAEWDPLRSDWRIVDRAVANYPVAASPISEVRRQIDEALGEDETAPLSEQQVRRIREITKSSDGWKRARESGGLSALPRGDATAAALRLVEQLRHSGLFVVPVGALEGWAPQLGDHGRRFVASALSANVYSDNRELRTFAADVAAFLGSDDK